MPFWRSVGSTVALTLVNLNVATCRSPVEEGGHDQAAKDEPKVVTLPGVDTSELTPREQKDWSTYVSELLAPCSDQPVSIVQCIKESRPCSLCLPAAKFLAKRVTRGGTRSQVEAAFRMRFSPDQVKTVDEGDSPAKGPKDAPVVIVEWADFQCPYCGAAAPVLDKVTEQYPEDVRLVFKNYPLPSHEHSEIAARAAVAAGKQGKFWEMHHALFENQQSGLDHDTILKLAKEVGVDEKKFVADWDSEAVADAVNADRKQAEKLDLRGTPMIYVNGRHFELEQRTGRNAAPKPVPSAAPPASAAPAPSAAPPAPHPAPSGSAKKP
jgi:protein-disulfide isomerase